MEISVSQEKQIIVKDKETILSYKSSYMDIFSRCCGDREIGLLVNNLAASTNGFISQLLSSTSMNFFIPENNEELLNLVHDTVRVVERLDTLTFNRFDPVLRTAIINLCLSLDISFSIILWNEYIKILRPDIKVSIFDKFDDEIKEKVSQLSDRLIPEIKPYIGKGFGCRIVKKDVCTRDCTKCPVAQSFNLVSADVITYTRARCPLFFGRQVFTFGRVLAQTQVQYRTVIYPMITSVGLFYIMERKMVKPVDFFNERMVFVNNMIDASFPDKRVEEQASILYYMDSSYDNISDIALNYVRGQITTFMPEGY
jgi:hypothetical protein